MGKIIQIAQISPSGTTTELAYANPDKKVTTVKHISVVNYSGGALSYTVYLNTTTGEFANNNIILHNGSLAANSTETFTGTWHLPKIGQGVIGVKASAGSSITFTINGERFGR